MTWPVPAQVGQARLETTWPRKPRCTLCTSPRPEQVVQVVGCVPGAVPAPVQRRAEDGGVDGDVLGGAEDRLVEVELDRDQRVAARRGCGCAARGSAAAAEEGVHDVAEAAEAGAAEAAGAAAAAGLERVTAEVDDAALLRVGQRLVGAGDLLERAPWPRGRG